MKSTKSIAPSTAEKGPPAFLTSGRGNRGTGISRIAPSASRRKTPSCETHAPRRAATSVPHGSTTSTRSTQSRVAPAVPGVKPEALQAIEPPTVASARLVGSTGYARRPSVAASTALRMSSRNMPTGATTVRAASSTANDGSSIDASETRMPPSGVALPVRFERPEQIVTGMPQRKQARRTMATSRRVRGRQTPTALPGRCDSSEAKPTTMSGSVARSRPKASARKRESASAAGTAPQVLAKFSIKRFSAPERRSCPCRMFVGCAEFMMAVCLQPRPAVKAIFG